MFHSTSGSSGTSNTISAEHKKLMGVNVNGGRRVGQWGSLGWDTRDPELELTHTMFRRIQCSAVQEPAFARLYLKRLKHFIQLNQQP